MRWNSPPTPGVLAPDPVPLAGTARFHRTAAYTHCLRCAGAQKRPTSGSGSFTAHSVLTCHPLRPREFDIHKFQIRDVDIGLHRILTGSTLPRLPQIRFTRGEDFGASVVRTLLRPVRLLAPLYGSDRTAPAIGDFYIWASDGSVTLPAARYDYNSDWTPLLAGLSPAGMAASLAALEHDSPP